MFPIIPLSQYQTVPTVIRMISLKIIPNVRKKESFEYKIKIEIYIKSCVENAKLIRIVNEIRVPTPKKPSPEWLFLPITFFQILYQVHSPWKKLMFNLIPIFCIKIEPGSKHIPG